MKPAIIWNLTMMVTPEIQDNWFTWLRDIHIPAHLHTGCFYDTVILKLHGQPEAGDHTYAVQFLAASLADYDRFMELHYQDLHREMTAMWGTDCCSFASVLEVVN